MWHCKVLTQYASRSSVVCVYTFELGPNCNAIYLLGHGHFYGICFIARVGFVCIMLFVMCAVRTDSRSYGDYPATVGGGRRATRICLYLCNANIKLFYIV